LAAPGNLKIEGRKMALKKKAKPPVKKPAGSRTARKAEGTNKGAGKSSAVKGKQVPAKKSQTAGIKTLLQQLMKISGELDEKGITFLIQQARVLEHNLQVERIGRDRKKTKIVDQIRQKSTRSNKNTIDVKEADDGSYYILIINEARNFFTLEEMRKLVSICHGASDEQDACRRLYNWYALHRKDVLIDTDISGAADPALSTIYTFIINRYKLKE